MGTLHQSRAVAELRSAFFHQHGFTQRPLLVQWMRRLHCPLHCPHCLCQGAEDAAPMPWARELRLLDEFVELELPELLLTGGEPLAWPDFERLLDELAQRKLRWSLNTALRPSASQMDAMRLHPPAFVALSLDGDEPFHDAFRGQRGAFANVIDAVSDFSSLCPQVAVGTTVHARNVDQLEALFGIVLGAGASAWGLHLCVPEGGGRDPAFRLSRRQLTHVLEFVARKRRAFPVALADEMGFCGEWEPLLRDAPFFCGAGRAQCVILPEGEVLPCTSLDRRHSAGRLMEQSLASIWQHGFASLRQWQPPKRCRDCRFAPACRGGCWLQRKHGKQCFEDVWGVRPLLGARAAAALCLGLSACSPSLTPSSPSASGVEPPALERAEVDAKPSPLTDSSTLTSACRAGLATLVCEPQPPFEHAALLEDLLVEWALAQARWPAEGVPEPGRLQQRVQTELLDDPARDYLLELLASSSGEHDFVLLGGHRDSDLQSTAARIEAALCTRYRSLSFAALLWTELARHAFLAPSVPVRSEDERLRLQGLLCRLQQQTEQWRAQIFEQQLDPFITMSAEERQGSRFMVKKSMIGSEPEQLHAMRIQLAMEHWGLSELTACVSQELLAAVPYGDGLALELEWLEGGELALCRLQSCTPVTTPTRLRIYDTLWSSEALRLRLSGTHHSFELELPGGLEVSWPELLRMVNAQHESEALAATQQFPGASDPILLGSTFEQYRAAAAVKAVDTHALRRLRSRLVETLIF